ncbi:hypothetical protein CFP65_0909 [Kitasatospora sp. MMS16-BH015]|nr:hypothetical protein CFP65_0909 [Kitasatospora sp. MMS16-BH015]
MHPLRRLPATAAPALVLGLALLGPLALPGATASAYDLRVRSWGVNTNGQLGDGTKTQRQTPVSVVGLSGAELNTVVAGGSGANGFALALLANGTVEAWGRNDKGQLGNGTSSATDDYAVPSLVAGLGQVDAVAAGGSHALALLKDGTVKAWGANDKGQLGDGTTNAGATTLPVTVAGLDEVKAIAAGDTFSMALLKDGTIKTWGNNDKGQLGITAKPAKSTDPVPKPTVATRTTAIAVPELSTVKGIAAGASHALALLADGSVMAWGNNSNGQLGDDTATTTGTGAVNNDKPYPVPVLELRNVTALSAGAAHSIALLQDRTLRGWGNNTNGQVGDGTLTQRTTSVPIPGLTGVVGIASGASHNLAVLADGTVQAWGLNDKGQLGDGTLTQRPTPVQVLAKSGNVSIVSAPSNGNFSLAR